MKINSLQGARGIAAILVVLFHLGHGLAAEKYFGIDWLGYTFRFGQTGVEFFFVLSGFIILHAHFDDFSRPDKLKGYLAKRIVRIYPPYIVIFVGVYLMAFLSTSLRAGLPTDPMILIKSLLLIPQDPAVVGGMGAPVLIVAWTLQYEMLFYLLFATFVLNRYLGLFTCIVYSLMFIYFDFDNGPNEPPFPLSFLFRDCICLFLMGMLVRLFVFQESLRVRKPAWILGFGLLLFSVFSADLVSGADIFRTYQNLYFGVACSLIVYGLVGLEIDNKVLMDGKIWRKLGDTSYVMYLIHYPLISICMKVLVKVGLAKAGLLGAILAGIITVIVVLIASLIFHEYIEKPILRFCRSMIERKSGQEKEITS